MPDKSQVRGFVSDLVLAIAVETVLAKVAQRLRYGRPCPDCGAKGARHRPVRRLLGAVVHELGAESASEMYLRRLRMRSVVDRMVDNQAERSRQHGHAPIPKQRRAPDELFAEMGGQPIESATPSGM
jgi:hypothetical protein